MSEELPIQETEAGSLTQLLQLEFPEAITEYHAHRGDETVFVTRAELVTVCHFLRDDPRCSFEIMMDLTAVDLVEMNFETRYEVVYHFKSLTHGHRLRVKVRLFEEDCHIDTISHLWQAVDWYERECWDMYGIVFEGHPNLKRLLMYDQFEGHPMRKDYPIDKAQPLSELTEIDERHTYGRTA